MAKTGELIGIFGAILVLIGVVCLGLGLGNPSSYKSEITKPTWVLSDMSELGYGLTIAGIVCSIVGLIFFGWPIVIRN